VTYAAKIDKAEARVDWTRPAVEVDRLIRGLSPFPGAWVDVNGERVKLLRSRLATRQRPPGQVLGGFTIACGDRAVEITEAQREGKRPMPARRCCAADSCPTGYSGGAKATPIFREDQVPLVGRRRAMPFVWLLIVGVAVGFLATRILKVNLDTPSTIALGVLGAIDRGVVSAEPGHAGRDRRGDCRRTLGAHPADLGLEILDQVSRLAASFSRNALSPVTAQSA
jgi:hypothetical protein